MNKEANNDLTYITTKILAEDCYFDMFSILITEEHGLLKKGDVISIDLLLRMYEDLYKQLHDKEVK